MSTDQQETRPAGSVPHAFRMAVAWRWTKEMPRPLRGGFLTLLYALAALADSNGRLRFARDGKSIRISDIAQAAGCDVKDCRRYLIAAEIAGVVIVQGERKRGRTALYIILVTPIPDWDAAAATLDSSRRKSRTAPPWLDIEAEKKGGVSPELSAPEKGGHTPELSALPDQGVRGTHPPTSSGDTPPNGSGDTPPNNPGSTQVLPHEMVEVVTQPQVDAPSALDKIDPAAEEDTTALPAGFVRCAKCHERMVPRQGAATHVHAHCAEDASAARPRRKKAS